MKRNGAEINQTSGAPRADSPRQGKEKPINSFCLSNWIVGGAALAGCLFSFLFVGYEPEAPLRQRISFHSSMNSTSALLLVHSIAPAKTGSPTLFVLLKREVNWWMKEMEWSAAVIKHITAKQQRNPIFDWSEAAAEVNHSIHSFINKSKFNNFHFYLIDSFHFDGMKRLNKNVL